MKLIQLCEGIIKLSDDIRNRINSIYDQFKLITDDDFIKKSIPSINDMINVVFEYFNKNYEKLRKREYREYIIDIIEKFNFSKSVNKLHNLLTYTR